jgi:hypothetical protein
MYLQALIKSKHKAHIINTPITNKMLNFNADDLTYDKQKLKFSIFF